MSWTIERRGRVAAVTMTTNPVNAQNRAFFADPHEASGRLERNHAESPVVLTGTSARFSAGLDLGEHSRCSSATRRPRTRWAWCTRLVPAGQLLDRAIAVAGQTPEACPGQYAVTQTGLPGRRPARHRRARRPARWRASGQHDE